MDKRLSKKQMRYLRESYQLKSDDDLAKELRVDRDAVQKTLKTMGLKRTKAEQKQVARIAEAGMRKEIRVEAGKEWIWTLLSLLSIVIVGAIVYSNTLHASWHFDDTVAITENWSLRNLRECFLGIFGGNRSVCFFTFAVNYHFGKLNVVGYHLINIAIHILNALLVYSLVILSLKTPVMVKSRLASHARFLALSSGLIFVSHPIQTQAVTYIVQRFASLATLFYLLSLVLFVRARLSIVQGKNFFSPLHIVCYLLSLFSAFLAMHTKEITFTLPFTICLYEFFFIESSFRSWGKRLLYLLPFILTLVVIPANLGMIGKVEKKPLGDVIGEIREQVQETTLISRKDYLLTQFNVIVTYIRLLFLPINQNLDYDYPIARSLFQFPTLLSFFFLLCILLLAIYLFRTARLVSFAIFWFFITLSVESSIIPIRDVIYEHRVYLPSVGFVILMAIFLHEVGESFSRRFSGSRER